MSTFDGKISLTKINQHMLEEEQNESGLENTLNLSVSLTLGRLIVFAKTKIYWRAFTLNFTNHCFRPM